MLADCIGIFHNVGVEARHERMDFVMGEGS
jgi:hypothetical protein